MSSKIEKSGKYAVTVKESYFDETQKGTPFLGVEFETAEGLEITGFMWLNTAAAEGKKSAFAITDETLRKAFGFNGDYETVAKQIKGKPAHIECAEDTYNGKTTMKVLFINAPRVEMADKGAFLKSLSKVSAGLAGGAQPKAKPSDDGNPF